MRGRQTPEGSDEGATERLADSSKKKQTRGQREKHNRRFKRHLPLLIFAFSSLVLAGTVTGSLFFSASQIKQELTAAKQLVPQLQSKLVAKNRPGAEETLQRLQTHTRAAKERATSVTWKMAGALPLIGSNFSAVGEMALSAQDLADGAARPLLNAYTALDWNILTPVDGKFDVTHLEAASPAIVNASNTVGHTYSRLSAIPRNGLLEEVSRPLGEAISTLATLRHSLKVAADTSQVLPSMLGSKEPRNYLLLVQNNAEIRATGGLPGALAVLRFDGGRIELAEQTSGAALGKFVPPVQVDPSQSQIYTSRLGSYISDVNLTPDFPTAASTAKVMWEQRHKSVIDGVIAIDPIVLSHLLEATGPIHVPLNASAGAGEDKLPHTLSTSNVVQTLLSDSYRAIDDLILQDAYFAAVARETFGALSAGKAPAEKLVQALVKSSDEGRILIWSDRKEEQKILSATSLSGSISGPGVASAAFGVYFNDGTGAKMDYYVERTVQLVEECTNDEYSETKVRVTLKNTAPEDAATALPASVTGGGQHGVPAGTVQTNTVIYGPFQSHLETAHQDGIKIPFGAQIHSSRPVGTVTSRLAPGQSTTFEVSFGKIVQNTPSELRVTPTVQPLEDILQGEAVSRCEGRVATDG